MLGWLMMATASALLFAALHRTLLANPDTLVPFTRNADVVPRHSVLLRIIAAVLFVAAVVFLGPSTGFWSALIPLGTALGAWAAIEGHNRRIDNGRADE